MMVGSLHNYPDHDTSIHNTRTSDRCYVVGRQLTTKVQRKKITAGIEDLRDKSSGRKTAHQPRID